MDDPRHPRSELQGLLKLMKLSFGTLLRGAIVPAYLPVGILDANSEVGMR
jgi:hypothetical protein